MDENERSEEIGEIVPPAEDGSAEQRDSAPTPQSHEDNRRFQAARLGGERAGYERAMRERAEREKADAEAERQKDWIAQDAAAFVRVHPDVDISKLDANAKFRRFCGSRYGKEPLSELYADWQELVGEEAAAKAVEKSAKKAERSTGAGGGGVSAGLTAAQQRELDEWNREFPHLKMTAKDFLER